MRFAQINKKFSTWGGWTELETNRLYWAVRYFGSDFDTMQSALFWNRTRADIKRKFTLPVGLDAEMDADAGTLQLLGAAVL